MNQVVSRRINNDESEQKTVRLVITSRLTEYQNSMNLVITQRAIFRCYKERDNKADCHFVGSSIDKLENFQDSTCYI